MNNNVLGTHYGMKKVIISMLASYSLGAGEVIIILFEILSVI